MTTKPKQAQVDIPYGTPALVAAAGKLVESHVFGPVTGLVRQLSKSEGKQPVKVWHPYLYHSEWSLNASKLALVDFSYDFGDSLETLQITLQVNRLESGGQEEESTFQAVLRVEGWGELVIEDLTCKGLGWAELLKPAVERFRGAWKDLLMRNEMIHLTRKVSRDRHLTQILERFWSATYLQPAVKQITLLDDPAEQADHSSFLEREAAEVRLISPWLATQLCKAGAVAGNPFNLPLWSRDNVDNPALEEALQRVAFTQVFGNSEDVALATNVGEI